MFPVTISIHNQAELSAVLAALVQTNVLTNESPKSSATDSVAASGQTIVKTSAARTKTVAESAHTAASVADKSPASTAADPNVTPTGNAAQGQVDASEGAAGHASVGFDELKTNFLALCNDNARDGRTKAVGILQGFGAKLLSNLTPEQYGAVNQAIAKARL